MPFEPTWIGLEIIILSEVSQRERQIPYDVTCMWNLKKADTDELICKTGTDSQTQKTILWLPNGKRGEINEEYRINHYVQNG